MDVVSYGVLFGVMTLASTWLVSFAYRNTKHLLKHKIAVKREAAVTKEMSKKLADDKKISRKEKDERILWKKNEVRRFVCHVTRSNLIPAGITAIPSLVSLLDKSEVIKWLCRMSCLWSTIPGKRVQCPTVFLP